MKSILIFSLITYLTGSPLLALAVIIIIYFFIDRRYIGLVPDFGARWRRKRRTAELEKVVRANPHNGDALLELGINYFDRRRYRQALDFLERAYPRMKDWPEVHFYLGAACYETGETGRGMEEIGKAVEMNPKISHGFPYIYMMRSLLEQKGGGAKELSSLEGSLLRHGSVQAFFEAGKLLKRHGRRSGAEKFFREVLENYSFASPTFRRTYRKMAIMSRYYLKNRS